MIGDTDGHIQDMKGITEELSILSCAHEDIIRGNMRTMKYKIDVIEEAIRALKEKGKDSEKELKTLEEERKTLEKEVVHHRVEVKYREVLHMATSFMQLHISEMDSSAFKISDLGLIFKATVSIQTQWKGLGIALRIDENELKKIEDSKFSTSRSLYQVLKYWIESTYGTWEKIVEAVSSEKVNQKELGESIKKIYITDGKRKKQHPMNEVFPLRSEKPITKCQDDDLSILFNLPKKTEGSLDWKVLGVLLNVPVNELENIDTRFSHESLEKSQRAMFEKWISTEEAYWSVLVKILNGPALGETELATEVARKHFKSNYKAIIKLPETQTGKFDENVVADFNERICHELDIAARKKQPRGIAFIITVSGVLGTDKDRNKIHAIFKRFGLATLSIESPTDAQLVSFAYAASQFKYPFYCEHRVLYFAGHGGFGTPADSSTDSNPQPYFQVLNDEKIFIQRDILEVFKQTMKPSDSFTLFFDCCLFNKEDLKVESYSIGVPPPRCFVAYGTSPGRKAIGYEEGGLYTSFVHENLEKLEAGEPLSKAMDLTHDAMKKEMEDRAKLKKVAPITASEDATIGHDADGQEENGSGCHTDGNKENDHETFYTEQLPLFVSSAGPVYINGVKSDVPPLPLERVVKCLQVILTTSDDTLLIELAFALTDIVGKKHASLVAKKKGREGASLLLNKVMRIVRSEPYLHGSVVKILKSPEFPQLQDIMKSVQSTMTFEEITREFSNTLSDDVVLNKEQLSKLLKEYFENDALDVIKKRSFDEKIRATEYNLRERDEHGRVKSNTMKASTTQK